MWTVTEQGTESQKRMTTSEVLFSSFDCSHLKDELKGS